MASAIGILDSNANCLISRTYTTDILPLNSIIENFQKQYTKNLNPIFKDFENGVHYIYIKSNDIILLCITYYDHINSMTLIHFLYKLKEILLNYFKTDELNKDLIIDNFNLIYEILDEVMDFGIPQFTDFTILKDFIKLELNESKLDISHSQKIESDTLNYINTSILRTTTSNISWRPKGIFYNKNEFFVDIIENLTMNIDFHTNKISKMEIKGSINIKSYLSGMPILKIGLNKKFKNLQFHQCVELIKFNEIGEISFIPPDGDFILATYSTPIKTLPIIQILNHEYITKNDDNIVLKLSIRTNLKQRTNLTNLKISIPISLDYDIDLNETPLFKSKIGKVLYKLDQDLIIWEIDSLGGEREFTMQALFKLKTTTSEPKEKIELGMDPPPRRTTPNFNKLKESLDMNDDEDGLEKPLNFIKFEFEIPDMALSGLKCEYLKIEEPMLKYPSFPWVRYKTINDEYIYRL